MDISVEELPVARTEIELSAPPIELDLLPAGARTRKALALVRLHAHPLGLVILDVEEDRSWRTHSPAVWSALGGRINAHLAADRLPAVDRIDEVHAISHPVPDCVCRRAAVLSDPPGITVIVGTRDRASQLETCLEALVRMEYPTYEVLVVDNDPATTETEKLIANRFTPAVRYIREDRRGLASAHNRGLQEVNTPIVAFTDDDVIVDRHWLTGIAEGFAADNGVACVTGLILPEELATPAQLLLHKHGAYDNKGYAQRVFDMRGNRPDDPLFPITAGKFGSGANMAFSTGVLREHGGFDPALGIGTKSCGGDELAAFVRVVLRHRLVYQPAAIVWHRHHREMGALRKQASNFGVATGAFLTSVMLHEPRMWAPLLRCLPAGIAAVASSSSSRHQSRFVDLPQDLERLEKLSMLYGPIRYAESRWNSRETSRQLRRKPLTIGTEMHETAIQRVGRTLQRVPAAHRVGMLALRCTGRIRRPRQLARYYRQVPCDKRGVFIGSGPMGVDGWLCTDLVPIRSSVMYLDATKRWPIPSSSLRYVVCEHMLSQVPLEDGLRVLQEAHRVLVPDGVLRISTANLDVIRALPDKCDAETQQYIRWSNRTFGSAVERADPENAAHVINRVMRFFGQQYLYDDATLRKALAHAGFRDIVRCEPGKSEHPELCGVDFHQQMIGDLPNRVESIILEATR